MYISIAPTWCCVSVLAVAAVAIIALLMCVVIVCVGVVCYRRHVHFIIKQLHWTSSLSFVGWGEMRGGGMNFDPNEESFKWERNINNDLLESQGWVNILDPTTKFKMGKRQKNS